MQTSDRNDRENRNSAVSQSVSVHALVQSAAFRVSMEAS